MSFLALFSELTSQVGPSLSGFLGIAPYVLACVVLPIVWGVIVNGLFSRWEKKHRKPHDSNFPDYQI